MIFLDINKGLFAGPVWKLVHIMDRGPRGQSSFIYIRCVTSRTSGPLSHSRHALAAPCS